MFLSVVSVFLSVVSNNDVHMGNSSCCGRSHGALVNEGSVLDRVISQASDHDECLLYRYCLVHSEMYIFDYVLALKPACIAFNEVQLSYVTLI